MTCTIAQSPSVFDFLQPTKNFITEPSQGTSDAKHKQFIWLVNIYSARNHTITGKTALVNQRLVLNTLSLSCSFPF